jgi:hypothetical protein
MSLLSRVHSSLRRRLGSEAGFTMIVAIGVLAVTSLLIAAVYVGVTDDVHLSQRDLDAKRAYYAARAGENAFLYQLNQDPNFWDVCSNDYQPNATAVPGSTTGEKYSFAPVYNPTYGVSNCSSNPISALIDGTTGTLRMEFTGYSGPPNALGNPSVSRTLVASFRKPSPLDFLWYTDHELKDPALDPANCAGEKYYYQYSGGNAPNACQIVWVSGDTMSGPSYTNDQYNIYTNNSPTFGRAGTNDQTESNAPSTSVCVNSSCQGARFLGKGPVPSARTVSLPQSVSSTQLLTDATAHGTVLSGTTTITLSGTQATIWNCPGTTVTAACTNSVSSSPIIYVQSTPSCPANYSLNTSYTTNNAGHYFGACGDVYVSGTYSGPLTIVSDHDIIVLANGGPGNGVTTSEDGAGNPTGSATLGLVAADFVRVMHPATSNLRASAVTIDAAILTLSHSFMVDNYSSGQTQSPAPSLTVHGAIAQRYRGIVGQVSGTGYLKDYHYDDRLHVILPPFLFDLSTSGWLVSRETLCTPNSTTSDTTSCSYQGP